MRAQPLVSTAAGAPNKVPAPVTRGPGLRCSEGAPGGAERPLWQKPEPDPGHAGGQTLKWHIREHRQRAAERVRDGRRCAMRPAVFIARLIGPAFVA
jgi:hypothetical protein